MPHDEAQNANTTLIGEILNRTIETLTQSPDFDAGLVERLRTLALDGGFSDPASVVAAITNQEESESEAD